MKKTLPKVNSKKYKKKRNEEIVRLSREVCKTCGRKKYTLAKLAEMHNLTHQRIKKIIQDYSDRVK